MDLLNCPFCGGEGSLASGVGEYWGRCMTCDASTAMTSVAERAITAWNTRTPSEAVLVEANPLQVAEILCKKFGSQLCITEVETWFPIARAALAAAKGDRV